MIRKCSECEWFDTSSVSNDSERGTCRIHPPQADLKSEYGYWPKVDYDDWCAAFKPAPETPANNDDDMPF